MSSLLSDALEDKRTSIAPVSSSGGLVSSKWFGLRVPLPPMDIISKFLSLNSVLKQTTDCVSAHTSEQLTVEECRNVVVCV